MPRRFRLKPYKVVKYSNETTNFAANLPATPTTPLSSVAVMIAPLAAQGMRKAKNFTLQIFTTSNLPIIFALVYVPQGTEPSKLTFGSPETPVSLYEPNQNVFMTGRVINYSAQQTWRTCL